MNWTKCFGSTCCFTALFATPAVHGDTGRTNSLAEGETENAAMMEQIVIYGTPPSRYDTRTTDALTGFPLDFLDLPRIVEVIPEQLLLDQKVTDLGEALRNVPGITQGDGFGGTNDDYFIRGFRRNTVYRDGLRRRSNFKTNTTNVERVEIVKGPAAIGFGQVEPGGLVNIVTKKPLDEPRNYVELRGGRFDDYFALLDVSQPVTERFALRINASMHDSESFRDFTEIQRDVVALTGVFDVSDATRLDLSYEYRDESRPLDRGTIAVPTPDGSRTIVDTPRSRRFGEAFEIFDTQFEFFSLDITHELSRTWQLRLAGAHETSDSDDIQVRPRAILIFDASAPIVDGFFTAPATPKPFFEDPTDRILLARRVDGSQDRRIDATYANAQLTGSVWTGSIEHLLSFSADYRESEESRFFGLNPNTDGITLPLFDINAPVYGTLSPGFSRGFDTAVEDDEYGFAVQDHIRINENFSALLGLRMDFVDADGSGPLDRVDELSPQVAVSYALAPHIVLFGSYSEAFIPNIQTVVDLDGNVSTSDPFPPEDSQQYEVGLKASLFEERFNLSMAAYDIDKENVVQGSGVDAILTEGQESRGFEISGAGQLIPGMNLVTGYAYTDASLPNGNRPSNVAKHTFNTWLSYEFQDGRLRGLGVGGGAFHASDRYGDNANTWRLGDYTLLDVSAWYNLPFTFRGRDPSLPTRLQFSVKNLTDETWYSASGFDNGQRINIGTPRTWYLALTTRW